MITKAVKRALLLALICSPPFLASASVRPGALPGQDPDWPCIQRKVPELSVAAVWTGPPVEEALAHWSEDAEVAALARRLAARRLPLEEAVAEVKSFAKELEPGEKAARLTALFAGLFETLGRERGEVMIGIERYARGQKGMAESIRAEQSRISDLSATADPLTLQQLNDQLVFRTRIFNERRQSLAYVCEVPTLIEQRLFALGRAIQAELPS